MLGVDRFDEKYAKTWTDMNFDANQDSFRFSLNELEPQNSPTSGSINTDPVQVNLIGFHYKSKLNLKCNQAKAYYSEF